MSEEDFQRGMEVGAAKAMEYWIRAVESFCEDKDSCPCTAGRAYRLVEQWVSDRHPDVDHAH